MIWAHNKVCGTVRLTVQRQQSLRHRENLLCDAQFLQPAAWLFSGAPAATISGRSALKPSPSFDASSGSSYPA